MNINFSNTYISKHENKFAVHIEMPDGSRNYLHCKIMDLESAIVTRELIDGQSIDHMSLLIKKHVKYPKYYQLIANLNCNDEVEEFHSRALNVNDAVSERMRLIQEE